MRLWVILILSVLVLGGVAEAQTPVPAADEGYVEGVAQSAFGNVTSQSYGLEAGVPVGVVTVFGEFGRISDVTTPGLSEAAAIIAGALSQVVSGVSHSVAEPVVFFAAGAKYVIHTSGKLQPYVLGGFGLASVKKDVVYNVDNADVTSDLENYGVVLGSDLSGSVTDPMFVAGAGATVPIGSQMFVDLQYRFNHIFADEAISVSRAGIGIGIRF